MPDLFLSYASPDRDRVVPLVRALTERGWSVWWDRTILPGKAWDQVIEDALNQAKCVIVVWSKNSVGSDWVRTEAEDARARGILVPVLIDEVPIPLAFRRIQAARLINWPKGASGAGLEDLHQAISQVLAGDARVGEARPIEFAGPVARPRSWRGLMLGLAALAVAALVSVGIWIGRWQPKGAAQQVAPPRTLQPDKVDSTKAALQPYRNGPNPKQQHARGESVAAVSGDAPPSLPEPKQSAAAAEAGPAPWPTFHGSEQRAGVARVDGPHRAPHVVWTAELGGQLRGSAVVGSGDNVYIGSTDRNLYAVHDGKVIWTFPADAPILTTPSIGRRGEIRFRSSSGTTFSVNESGQLLPAGDAPPREDSARLPGGRLYYTEGALLKSAGRPDASFEERIATWPVVTRGGGILVGGVSGNLSLFDPDGGANGWSFQAGGPITSTPAATDEGDAIFGCADRSLYCVRKGELRWKFPTSGPIFSAPVVDRAGVAYFGSNDGNLYAVSAQGEELWRAPLGNEIRSSPAFDRQGRIYVASINRKLYCIGP